MWQDINKTSAQSAINEFLDNLEDWVLRPDEKINEAPTSFTNLYASTLGKISAYSNFSMLMAKREITPSTAVQAKSLLRQLKSDDIKGIYGSPSSMQLVISYPQQDIINQSVLQPDGKYKLTLNKNTQFIIGDNPPMTLDYNIDIYTTPYTNRDGSKSYSIYAMYNTDDLETGSVISINNPYLNTRNDVVIENRQMFSMYVDVKQYERITNEYEMTGEPKNINVEYADKLIGFVVLYKAQSSTKYQSVKCYLEGETYSDGLGYTLSNNGGVQTIKLKFSKLPDAFNPTNGVLKVIVYTTKGSAGNFSLGQVDTNTIEDTNVIFNQDISDEPQYALVNMIPTCSIISSEAAGGKDDLDLEGIRELVIQSERGEVITPTSLSIAAKKNGFSSHKKRHDMYSLEYTLSSFLNTKNDVVIPSKMINAYFSYSDLAVESGSNSRIITPADGFDYDPDLQAYKWIPNSQLSVYNTFYTEYKRDLTKEQYKFPYFIRIQNGDTLEVSVFDESIEKSAITQSIYIDNSIYDKASITSIDINRNPISVDTLENGKAVKDYYYISFDVYISDYIYNHLKAIAKGTSVEDQYIKFRLMVKNTSDGSIYSRDIGIEDISFDLEDNNILHCTTKLHTNSSVLADGKINIDETSLKSVPYSQTQYSFYYIDPKVNIDVAVIFKSNEDISDSGHYYNEYLTSQEIADNYFIGIIYECENIELVKDISKEINIVSDLKFTQPVYERAEEDIPDTYSENVYKTNSENEYEIESSSNTLPDGTVSSDSKYVLLHSAGDVKQNLDGRVGSFNAVSGDNWKWSDETTETGIYNGGSVLGGLPIYALIEWNDMVIFAGEEGRIGCYDIRYNKWHDYNEVNTANSGMYRSYDGAVDSIDASNTGYVIKGQNLLGTYKVNGQTKVAAIRGLKLIKDAEKGDCLIAYGDLGRVVSCKLSNNFWTTVDNSTQDPSGTAVYSNNGSCINGLNETNALYCCEEYTYTVVNTDNTTSERKGLVFAGGSGRICSLTLGYGNSGWHNFDSDEGTRSRENIFSDGSIRNYNSILASAKNLESSIYFTGINGVSSYVDLTTGAVYELNSGDVVDNKTMYTAIISGSSFVEAGKDGYIASYNFVKNQWTNYDANSGLSSNGAYNGNVDIFATLLYGTNILFCGEYGRICNYETLTNVWESYDSQAGGLTNTGSFIGSSISCVIFDTENGNNVIYFGSKAGNITYKYRKGDIIYNDDGTPKIKEDSTQVCYLYGIPAYSRVYSIPDNFNDIIDAYTRLIDKIASMDNIFVDEGNLYLGVKTTSGVSSTYYFYNKKSGEKEFLDSLAISLNLGVKFDSNITSENSQFLISNIKEKIILYIKNIQNKSDSTDVEFNIIKMFDEIKNEIPSIKYFEYYGLNNYDSTECQTIYHDQESDDELNNEYLCIQNVVDEANSNISNNDVVFAPNITISIL